MLDLIQMCKLILNIIIEFLSNISWCFVDQDYVFLVLENLWLEEFLEIINENNVVEDLLEVDFVVVKIGDVNGSV